MEHDLKNTITISIHRASDEDGFMYDIYDREATDTDLDGYPTIDGGQCTSDNILDALEMATQQVKEVLSFKLQ